MASILIALVILAGKVLSAPTAERSSHIYGECQQFILPITASANSAVYDIPTINDDISAEAWAVWTGTWSSPQGNDLIIKNTTTSGTYNIHAQLCVPNSAQSNKSNVLQIATHGAFYDSRYWDSKLEPEKYSYVEAALKAGYSILTYDRLGTGLSDHPSVDVVQAPLELEILKQITLMARNGMPSSYARFSKPSKVVHVGHSFGSFLTSAFVATYPTLSDGAIITGYIVSEHLGAIGYTPGSPMYPPTANPPFDRPDGYIVFQKQGVQAFFFTGDFTSEQLDYGDEIKQPCPIGELTSGYQLVGVPGPEFKGPIHYMLAELDFFICGGDCKGVYSMEQLRATYPKAAAIEVDIQPDTGHALPLHNNATAGFQVSFDFLERHGLGPAA